MNVSLQSTLSSKGICESELVRTYKMRQFGTFSLAQEGKERKQTNNDRLTQGRWMEIVPINQMAHFIPRQEQRSVHSKRFVLPTHAYQGGQRLEFAKCGPKATSIRTSEISTFDADSWAYLKPTNPASLGAELRNLHLPQAGLFCYTSESEDHCCRGPLHC